LFTFANDFLFYKKRVYKVFFACFRTVITTLLYRMFYDKSTTSRIKWNLSLQSYNSFRLPNGLRTMHVRAFCAAILLTILLPLIEREN